MKRFIRLASLLLAVLMLLSVMPAMASEVPDSIPMEDVDNNIYKAAVNNAGSGSQNSFFETYYKPLVNKSVQSRYEKLVQMYEKFSGTSFYANFLAYCAEEHSGENLICTCEMPLPYGADGHADGCPWKKNNVPSKIEGSLNGASVSVAGNLPVNAVLSLESASFEDVKTLVPEVTVDGVTFNPLDAFEGNKKIVMDLSILDEGQEWQPEEGEPVSVTMDVSDIGKNGDNMMVYHLHEAEDGTYIYEEIGSYRVNDGEIQFEMSGFSYVFVYNMSKEITDVDVFYAGTLEGSDSTNDQLTFLGVYYKDGYAHFLVAFAGNSNASQAESKLKHVTLENTTIAKSNMVYDIYDGETSEIKLKDESGNVIYTAKASGKGTYGGYFDINFGKIQIAEGFFFGVNNKISGNGWKIGGNLDLDLDYKIIKKVAKGQDNSAFAGDDDENEDIFKSVTVDRGDWVIFKINVNNIGTRPLTNMLVQDILPEGVFDMDTVLMSIDGEDGEIGNWESFNQTMFADYSSKGGFSRLLYVKAQVKTGLVISADTTYTNTATIDGIDMPTNESSATVTVKAPTTGELVVMKSVSTENPNVSVPDTAFAFTIHSDGGAGPFNYTIDEKSGRVENNGTFNLKSGQTIKFANFPNGAFKVTEAAVSGYTTEVNGEVTNVYSGVMDSYMPPTVAFTNTLNMSTGSLTISKSLQQGEVPSTVDTFAFDVIIVDGFEAEKTYDYSIIEGGITVRTVKNGIENSPVNSDKVVNTNVINKIELKAGQSIEILNLPIGATYTVSEVNIPASYEFASVEDPNKIEGQTAPEHGTTGKVAAGGSTVAFTNKYKIADLTITKIGLGTYEYKDRSDNESAIVTVSGGGKTWTVALTKDTDDTDYTAVIKGLTVGTTYTITEQNGWTWRYTPEVASITHTMNPPTGNNTVTIKNKPVNGYWLGGDNYAVNDFGIGTGN